jgi:hypothetical protein
MTNSSIDEGLIGQGGGCGYSQKWEWRGGRRWPTLDAPPPWDATMSNHRDDATSRSFGSREPERRRVRRREGAARAGPIIRPDWRDAAAYGALRAIDRAGIMWEFLRRDAGYVAWQANASTATSARRGAIVRPEQWGLHFR